MIEIQIRLWTVDFILSMLLAHIYNFLIGFLFLAADFSTLFEVASLTNRKKSLFSDRDTRDFPDIYFCRYQLPY